MLDFIKKYKFTITIVLLILVGIGAFIAIKYYKNNVGVYNPYSEIPDYVLQKQDINNYQVINKNKEDVYRAYYKEFVLLLATDTTQAFNKLESKNKEQLFGNNYERFKEYANSLNKNLLLKSDIKKYFVEEDGINKRIVIIDTTDSSYTFIENGVWNYTVSINK